MSIRGIVVCCAATALTGIVVGCAPHIFGLPVLYDPSSCWWGGGSGRQRAALSGVAAFSNAAPTSVVVDQWATKACHSLCLFVPGCMVTKGLAGDSGRRRQEGGVNTTISQKRDVRQRGHGQRQRNRQQPASKTKGREGGATQTPAQ
jgi:hypothetical protein